MVILHHAGQAPCLRSQLTANVRHQTRNLASPPLPQMQDQDQDQGQSKLGKKQLHKCCRSGLSKIATKSSNPKSAGSSSVLAALLLSAPPISQFVVPGAPEGSTIWQSSCSA